MRADTKEVLAKAREKALLHPPRKTKEERLDMERKFAKQHTVEELNKSDSQK